MAKVAISFAFLLCQIVLIFADFSKDDCEKDIQGIDSCRGHFLVYKYDATTRECVQAVYGGCDPTNNNFARQADCERIAKPICNSPSFFTSEDCNKDIEGEKCGVKIAVYKWDVKKQACVQAVYGGCNPTHNNFRDIKDCQKYAEPVCKQ